MKNYKILKQNKLKSYGFEMVPEIGGYEKTLIDTGGNHIALCLISNIFEDDTTTPVEQYTYSFSLWCDNTDDYLDCADLIFDAINELKADEIIRE